MDPLNLNIYFPFEKKNSDERIVEGYATTEALDSQGEIVKSDAIEKALPDYMKFANIREMHQHSAVGKTISAQMDDSKKGMKITAKIVDPVAWEKVKEGVYNGFSIGGRVLKRVGNVIHSLTLNEISIVDRPANPEAVFSLVKFADKTDKADVAYAPEQMAHPDLENAACMLGWAQQLAYWLDEAKGEGEPYDHLEAAIQALKVAAVREAELDKVAKSKASEEEKEKKMALAKELEKVKKTLEAAISSKALDRNWSDPYFSQHNQAV